MQTINSILVPVDFSDVSTNAFRYALRLADHLDASIDLLHVVPDTDGSLVSLSLTARLVTIGEEKLATFFAAGIKAEAGKLKLVPSVQTFVKKGRLRASIRQHVTANHTNLIVMGTHGENQALADELFGSNTSILVNRAPCPVLVVPKEFAFKPLHSVCYATDLTHIDAFHAGHLLKALRVFNPRLDFVHVKTGKNQRTKFNMDLLREVFDRPDKALETQFHVLEDNDLAEQLFAYAEKANSDLVVMHRPHHNWLSRLFTISNTREAVLEARVPLLILPQENEGGQQAEVTTEAEQAAK